MGEFPTNDRLLKIKDGQYTVTCDRSFCNSKTEMHDLIERLDAMMDRGVIVKKHSVSCVSRLTWNGRDLVVKRYNHRSLVHSLRHTTKTSRARRAWLYGLRLEMLNIPTPKPLACIDQRKAGLVWKSYLVTEYVEGRNLHEFLHDQKTSPEQRMAVTQAAWELIEKLWNYRITHGDLKHTNVLVTANGPVLTDLDAMALHRWRVFYRHKQAKDKERFLRATGDISATPDYAGKAATVKQEPSHRLAGDYDELKIDGWAIRIRRDFPKQNIRSLLSVSDSLGDSQGQFSRVPSSGCTRVYKYHLSLNGIDLPLYIKRHLRRSWLDFAKHIPRQSRAERAFSASLMLQSNGFDTPAIIGLLERRFGPFTTDSMLVTQEVQDATAMPQLLRDISRRPGQQTLAYKRSLIRAFAQIMGRMHAKGIFHGDLRLGNVLVVREHQDWRFYFIDNERTKKFRSLPPRLRLKNLVQVNMFFPGISTTDRLRFLRTYLELNPDIQEHRSAWISRIIAKTNRRLRHKHWPEE